jgi:dTDP-4-dehydrorhamnose 3,5-epimerase
MIFKPTRLQGAYVIELDREEDHRGFFARAFCRKEFEEHGLNPSVVQCNVSRNRRAGTIRGLHFQRPPSAEAKLVRCLRGAIYDVIVDLRPGSPTYLEHFGAELNEENGAALYVPEMFAHGYQALTDDAEALYQVSEFFAPACEGGLRYDDPALGIRWPAPVTEISAKDRAWPLLEVARTGATGW